MSELIEVCEPVGKTVFPIRYADRVGNPSIGHVVKDPKGWIAIPEVISKHETAIKDTRHEAIDYLRRTQE